MSRFLLIEFDRYDTHKTQQRVVEASSHEEVVRLYAEGDVDGHEYYKNLHQQVNPTFSCCALEEMDILIYNLDLILPFFS